MCYRVSFFRCGGLWSPDLIFFDLNIGFEGPKASPAAPPELWNSVFWSEIVNLPFGESIGFSVSLFVCLSICLPVCVSL